MKQIRKEKQIMFNKENGIKPKSISKNTNNKILDKLNRLIKKPMKIKSIKNASIDQLNKMIKNTKTSNAKNG